MNDGQTNPTKLFADGSVSHTVAKPMKADELRAAATCAICRKKIGECQIPLFYVLTMERHYVDLGAIQRQTGLESFLGSPLLAAHMGPNEDMTKVFMDRIKFTVCENCAGNEEMSVHALADYGKPKDKNED